MDADANIPSPSHQPVHMQTPSLSENKAPAPTSTEQIFDLTDEVKQKNQGRLPEGWENF